MKLIKTGLFLSKNKVIFSTLFVIQYIIWLIIRVIRISGQGQVPKGPDKRRSSVLLYPFFLLRDYLRDV